jgi:uncharacterized protein YjbJ (UPF0337 family)
MDQRHAQAEHPTRAFRLGGRVCRGNGLELLGTGKFEREARGEGDTMEKTPESNPVNVDILAGRWKHMRGELRSWWGRLTDNDLEQIGGQHDKLIGKLQERYSYTRERAQQEVERRLQEYHARLGAASPSDTTPPMGPSTQQVGSRPAKDQAAESSAAATAANQATAAVGEQLGSLAGMIRDKAPSEGTTGQVATAAADTLGAAGAYLQEKKVEHMGGDVTDLIRRYPVPSLLIGLGIGYLLARSLRR